MGTFLDVFYDIVRQGLPTIGAISGLTWATADGVARQRREMVLRGALGASIGWGAGYLVRTLTLNAIDGVSAGKLPETMASLGPSGPVGRFSGASGGTGWTEPGTMPNPTQHPPPMTRASSLPKSTTLEGETDQTLDFTARAPKASAPKSPVQIEGTLIADAFGT